MIYDVTQEDTPETEEPMPYTAEQQFDPWTPDEVRAIENKPVYSDLPGWLTDLRDGTAVASATTGLARQQRLAQMEQDISSCVDFVTDCDRYNEALNHYPNPCVGDLVPRMMGQHLRDLRGRALRKHKRLQAELAVLRRQG